MENEYATVFEDASVDSGNDTGRGHGLESDFSGVNGRSEGTSERSDEPKRGPGRPRKPRDAAGNIIRAGADDTSGGGGGDRATGERGPVEVNVSVGQPEARITASKDKPKATRSGPRSKTGSIKPEHVESWMTQIFAFTATMRNLAHWKVADPEIEIRPWAPQAAELLNTYVPKERAENLIAMNAAVAVVMGISIMVYKRTELDRLYAQHIRLESARANAGNLRAAEGVPPQAQPQPYTAENVSAANGHISGTGAQPTPVDPIPGFNVRKAM